MSKLYCFPIKANGLSPKLFLGGNDGVTWWNRPQKEYKLQTYDTMCECPDCPFPLGALVGVHPMLSG